MELMISQKNQSLELIKNYELEPFNFKWDERDSYSILKYENEGYYFICEYML